MTRRSAIRRLDESLKTIEQNEKHVHAWERIDVDDARAQAETIDRQPEERLGALSGVLLGVKDIVDVAGFPTTAGFEPFRLRVASGDADVVRSLRNAGAVVLGKTVTTQFAFADPPPTRNPWNLDRTPGGSSSGSAAAVAARHVPLAIGSQTAGSILRPAAYCGVVGFKPGFGWTSRRGMLPLAGSLDTVGFLGESVDMVARAYVAVARTLPDADDAAVPRQPTAIGVWMDALDLAEPDMRSAIQRMQGRFTDAGCAVEDLHHETPYRDMLAVHLIVMMSEAATAHERLLQRYPDSYSPQIRADVECGATIRAFQYIRAQRLREQFREVVARDWSHLDVIVLPTAVAGAPTRETTGDRRLQSVVSLLGLPAISIPIGLDHDGLPLGLQLVSPRIDGNVELLQIARWVESLIPPLSPPNVAPAAD